MQARQIRAAQLLGRGHQRSEVSRELDVSAATLSRWRHLPEFQRAESLASEKLVSETSDVERAQATLVEALDCGVEDVAVWKVRIAAAQAILKVGQVPAPEECADYVLPDDFA